jgi:hypothetical protein
LDALFFLSVYWRCPSLLHATGIRVPSRNVRNSSLFTAACTNPLSARCVTAANRVCKAVADLGWSVSCVNPLISPCLQYLWFLKFRFCRPPPPPQPRYAKVMCDDNTHKKEINKKCNSQLRLVRRCF